MYFKPISIRSVSAFARYWLERSCQFKTGFIRGCLMVVVCYTPVGFAEVYKCRSLEGQLKYQDYPCRTDSLSAEKMALGNPAFRREHEVQGLLIQLRKRLEGQHITTDSLYTLDVTVKHYGDAQCQQLVGNYAYKGLKSMENDAYQQQWQRREVRMMPIEFLINTEQQVQAQTMVSILTPVADKVEKSYFSLWVDVRFGTQAPRILEQRLCSLNETKA